MTVHYDALATLRHFDTITLIRICLDFTVNKFYIVLFCLPEVLFVIFTLFVLANRPLFASPKQSKSAQKHLSAKLEIKSKQILIRVEKALRE